MGQLCSSEQIQHESRKSLIQKRQSTSRQNDYYAQGNINVPPVPEGNKPLFSAENDTTNYNTLYRRPNQENIEQQEHWVKPDQYYQQQNNNTQALKKDCPICQESFEWMGERPVLTICNHAFCSKCARGAFEIHSHCPICLTYQSKPLYDHEEELVYDTTDDESHSYVDEYTWNVEIARARIKQNRSQNDIDPEKTCPICMAAYRDLEKRPVLTICDHEFCPSCAQDAFQIHPYCPICLTYQSERLFDAEGKLVYDLRDDISRSPLDINPWNTEIALDKIVRARWLKEKEEYDLRYPVECRCPICQNPYEVLGEKPILTICDHGFCSTCVKEAFQIHPYCPTCLTYQSERLYDAEGQLVYDLREDGFHSPLGPDSWNVEIALDRIVRARYKKEQDEWHEKCKTHCPMCATPFADLEEKPVSTTCNHDFCSECLRQMLSEQAYCIRCAQPQTEPLYDHQGQLLNPNYEIMKAQLEEESKQMEIVRAQLINQPGEDEKRVYLSNGEATNIVVKQGTKIQVNPNSNLMINGKRVENPQDCNVQ